MSFLSLAAVAALVLVLSLTAPLFLLLLADLQLVLLQDDWQLAGINFSASDLILFGLAAGLLLRSREGLLTALREIPRKRLWVLLGVLLSLSYLAAPENQQYLTDPARIAYQLYRYAWKPILLYPLAVILLANRTRIQAAAGAVILAGDLCALQAIPQGYTGLRASGPFDTPNVLGAALVVPLILCMALLLYPTSRRTRIFAVASLVVLIRALLFSGSRGAIVGIAAGTFLLFLRMLSVRAVRPHLAKLALAASILSVLVVLAVPDLFQRPNVQRLLSLSEGVEASTFQWRIEERWPHFWERALEHPWLGWSTDVDESLGTWANTPHNGFLALAVRYGFPALIVYLLLMASALRANRRGFRQQADPWTRMTCAATSAALVGVLIHNIVDQTLVVEFIGKQVWLALATSAIIARYPERLTEPLPDAASAPPAELARGAFTEGAVHA